MTALDCGHPAQPSGCMAGLARDAAGRTSCIDCANASERRHFADPATTRFFGYLVRDDASGELSITTWPGATLARVTSRKIARVGFGRSERWYLRVQAPDGSRWIGTSPGPGMYARLRRAVAS